MTTPLLSLFKKNFQKSKILFGFVLFITFLLIACSSENKLSGISTVETENAFIIQVQNADSVFIPGVIAKIRASSYLRTSLTDTNGILKEYEADSLGQIYISETDSLFSDSISLEIIQNNTGAFTILPLRKKEYKDSVITMTLKKLGSIRGNILLKDAEKPAFVQIFGTDKIVKTDSSGNYFIDSLPPFVYTLQIVSEDSSFLLPGEVETGKTSELNVLLKKHTTFYLDSLISSWMDFSSVENEKAPIPYFIRLDTSNFDFNYKLQDIEILNSSNERIPYANSYYNDSLYKAVLMVALPQANDSIKLVYENISDNISITKKEFWENFDTTIQKNFNAIRLLDFENGMSTNLKYPATETRWYLTYQGDSVTSVPDINNPLEGIEFDSVLNSNVFHLKSSSPKTGTWTNLGFFLCVANNPCNLEALDSIVYYIKGNLLYSFALESVNENNEYSKAIFRDSVFSDTWIKKSIKPADFMKPDTLYGIYDFEAIKHKITNINISFFNEAEVYLDVIEFYGINLDDLKQ